MALLKVIGSKLTVSFFLYLQVVHPHLPLGQLDGAVGEGGADGRHFSLLVVSVRHSRPQQLSLAAAPRLNTRGLSDPNGSRGHHGSEAISRFGFCQADEC